MSTEYDVEPFVAYTQVKPPKADVTVLEPDRAQGRYLLMKLNNVYQLLERI